jgi:pimeloyl-ACP methyl ester carboxylesterase
MSVQIARRASNDVLALAALLRAPSGPTLDKTALASLRIPVLSVAGTADFMLSALGALKPVIPHFEVVAIQGAGHMATFSRPEFVQAISKFIDAHPVAQHQ